jgi:hypothetical protein
MYPVEFRERSGLQKTGEHATQATGAPKNCRALAEFSWGIKRAEKEVDSGVKSRS